ncbi:hypothetical protein EWM64_g6244 [Hericium alpestre]|uniref:Uncharacterized protein n=1 Tax=Hericium alpestre TaxID=135208 RepID=A0A4Y9ZWA2_9AGAM|nr:hypothetical protein EWM64_g6244 [Hericium alpestre]
MPSFAKIASFAALAFGALVSAAPLSAVHGAVGKVASAVPAVPAFPRHVAPICIEGIFNDLTDKLTPITGELNFIVTGNATQEVLGPIVDDIKSIIQDAVSTLNTLVGKPVDEILVSVDGTVKLTLGDVAELVAGVLTIVFTAIGKVLRLASIDVSVVVSILAPIAELVAALLSVVLKLVGGVLGDVVGAVLPLIGGLIPVILQLNVAGVISILHI